MASDNCYHLVTYSYSYIVIYLVSFPSHCIAVLKSAAACMVEAVVTYTYTGTGEQDVGYSPPTFEDEQCIVYIAIRIASPLLHEELATI